MLCIEKLVGWKVHALRADVDIGQVHPGGGEYIYIYKFLFCVNMYAVPPLLVKKVFSFWNSVHTYIYTSLLYYIII